MRCQEVKVNSEKTPEIDLACADHKGQRQKRQLTAFISHEVLWECDAYSRLSSSCAPGAKAVWGRPRTPKLREIQSPAHGNLAYICHNVPDQAPQKD